MTRHQRLVIWGAAALGLGASTAVAQVASPPSPLQQPGAAAQQASYNLGVPTTAATNLALYVETMYSSNVASSDAELAQERGLKLADEITTPSAVFNLARVLGGDVVFLKGAAGYDFYSVNHKLDRERVDVTGGASAHLLTCQELATGEYRRSQLNLVEATTATVSDAVQVETVTGVVSCGGAMGLTPTLSVSNTWRTNSAASLAETNSNFLSVNAGMGYRQPAVGVFSVTGQFGEVEFPNAQTPTKTGLVTEGFDLYAAGVMYDRRIGARLDGSASISYTWIDQNLAGAPGFRGYTYALDFKYPFTRLFGGHVRFSRAATPSTQVGATFSINQSYEADLGYRLGAHTSVRLTGYDTQRNFGGQSLVLLGDFVTKQTARGVRLACTYNFTQRLSLTLDTGDEARHSDLAELNNSAFHVGLTAAAKF